MLRFIRPTIPPPQEWLGYLELAYSKKWFTNFGPVLACLEQRLTEKYASPDRQAVLVASATAGITASLMALGIRGRVLLPSFTFAATLQGIRAAGCEPIFCDVCSDLWEMTAATVQTGLAQGDVACVLAVRSYGLCRDLSEVQAVCDAAGVPLIVDAAAALGGVTVGGTPAGSQGDAEIFSLHATKVFGIGEGGVVFAPKELAAAIRTAINFGITQDGVGAGFNGKLSELPCAVGLAVLNRFDSFLATRRALASRYYDRFASRPDMLLPKAPGDPPWQCFPIQLTNCGDAGKFVEKAFEGGLELRRYYRPALYKPASVSERLAETMVCLPIYSDMTMAEQDLAMDIVEASLS